MPFCAYCGTQVAEVSYAPCPQCGNPSNGAPRGQMAPVPAPRSTASTVVIIVVAAVIFIFLIIGILAAIAIPNLLTAQERSKQKRSMADLRSVAVACEAYATDTNRYPDVRTIDELGPVLAPTYIREVPKIDGWGHGLRYECWSRLAKCDTYAIASAGKDGQFEHESLQDYESGTIADFNGDLVFSNGNFVRYPDATVTR